MPYYRHINAVAITCAVLWIALMSLAIGCKYAAFKECRDIFPQAFYYCISR